MISNFDKLCVELEKQELEAANGVASPSTYAQLLVIYLYQNDLNPEIAAIWAVGQKLWKKDLAGTYQALATYNWTEPVANITRALEERVRERAFHLIGRSYSSISLDTVVSMTGLSRDTVLRACADRKWVLSEDGATVNPTPPTQPAPLHTSSEDQLFKLTEFVSFLEN
ncbi:hypothetical protein MSG28_002274 [Choristoneura fumiferana]|uniref:Uncharacterized protein n=2 Tax=Choristoneura fumiferana TaxID=7141 RepID=A0ACC0JVM2_CHOFU|nr:hypothetical protein MSG28_002274 [Choristoneura fumiferana]KAI8427958.1 hypothetical protein MSG28_002274 [Choristoneura fumiferana]